jgi:hypothetical protein
MQILFLHSYFFLLPYKNIYFTLILEHHKKSGEWEKIEFPEEYYIWIWEQQDLRGRQRNKWQDGVREDGKLVGGEGWQEKVHNREEWKRLLRTARNRRILHMPVEWMNKRSGVWLWGLVSDSGIANCWLFLLDFVSKHTLPINLYTEWCVTCTNSKVFSYMPIYYTD